MKHMEKGIILGICILLITGCGNEKSTGSKADAGGNSVDKVINNQINNAQQDSDNETEDTKKYQDNDGTKGTAAEDAREAKGSIDYDLTKMSSDMVYATVYQMMTTPEQYVGKTFRMAGNFNASYYEPTGKYYYYCIIQDATSCCAQGLEFVWGDGSHIYPDEYPEDNAEIVVEGTFETYKEEGDQNLYCKLSNAILQQKN